MSTRNRRLWWLAVLTVIGLFAPAASAQIYKWVDAHGTVHFADTPPIGLESSVALETRPSEPPPPIVRDAPSEAEDTAEAYDDGSVVASPEPGQSDEPGDAGWVAVTSAGKPLVFTPRRYQRGQFGRQEMRHHGSGKTLAREQHVSPPQTTVRTQRLNRSPSSFGGPRKVAARSGVRGRL